MFSSTERTNQTSTLERGLYIFCIFTSHCILEGVRAEGISLQWHAQTFLRAGAKIQCILATEVGTLAHFGSLAGTLSHVLAPKRTLKRAFFPPKRLVYHILTSHGGSLVCFTNQEGILAHVLAPKKTLKRAFFPPKRLVYHILTSHGGSLVCFANQEEGILAHVLAPKTAH